MSSNAVLCLGEGASARPIAPHIVIVDDQSDLREMVQEYLVDHGCDTSQAASGEELRHLMDRRAVDLVILDLNMPEEDGLAITRQLKVKTDVRILMLTASSAAVDKMMALQLGVDDYITKPLDLRELLARVRAVLRRKSEANPAPLSRNSLVKLGRYQLDIDNRRLYSPEGGEVHISSTEFGLLAAFTSHPGRVLSREKLLDLAYSRELGPLDRSLDGWIARLRQKIEANPARPSIIRTVRGTGYVYVVGDMG